MQSRPISRNTSNQSAPAETVNLLRNVGLWERLFPIERRIARREKRRASTTGKLEAEWKKPDFDPIYPSKRSMALRNRVAKQTEKIATLQIKILTRRPSQQALDSALESLGNLAIFGIQHVASSKRSSILVLFEKMYEVGSSARLDTSAVKEPLINAFVWKIVRSSKNKVGTSGQKTVERLARSGNLGEAIRSEVALRAYELAAKELLYNVAMNIAVVFVMGDEYIKRTRAGIARMNALNDAMKTLQPTPAVNLALRNLIYVGNRSAKCGNTIGTITTEHYKDTGYANSSTDLRGNPTNPGITYTSKISVICKGTRTYANSVSEGAGGQIVLQYSCDGRGVADSGLVYCHGGAITIYPNSYRNLIARYAVALLVLTSYLDENRAWIEPRITRGFGDLGKVLSFAPPGFDYKFRAACPVCLNRTEFKIYSRKVFPKSTCPHSSDN